MVLISVLWVILILSLLSFSLAAAVRAEMAVAQNSFDSERAFFMAKGAAETVFHSIAQKQDLTRNSPILVEQGEYVFPFDGGEARVRFDSDGGKISLNSASDELLVSMFDAIGLDERVRNEVVDSILDWRDADDVRQLYGAEVDDYPQNASAEPGATMPRNASFQSVDELLLVKNMTNEIFYGGIVVSPDAGEYRRIPGIRDLVTVSPGDGRVNVNLASRDVLASLPQVTAELAETIVSAREEDKFTSVDDLLERVPEIAETEALAFMSFESAQPTALVAKATIRDSGVSRAVRMLYRQERVMRFLSYDPLLYIFVDEARFDRWQME
jgi:general secretion pathway protein K